ncbi:MAG: PorT family protein [Flavobacteriales bacterium]|nr:PorT family protein [Flavobacteriales bacterium]MBP9078661.1 PorT family protein [Flavobacteriales bacterium]
MRLRKLLLPFLLLLAWCMAPPATAQRAGVKVENLPNFDLRRFHFGFLLSYNTSDLFMTMKPSSPFTDSLLAVDHVKQPGFNLGIVASLNMSDNLSLRFLPTLSFQDRILKYAFLKPDGKTANFQKPIESTYLEFPLLLKFRSDRINNFAVYLIGGGKFGIDMASKKDVDNALDEDVVVKLAKYDYSAEVGGGMDMFLPYFKFGIELKTGIGIPNLLVDDGTRFSSPLQSLRSKTYVLTFTFEG